MKKTGGEIIESCLVKEGVKYVFGVCGAQLLPLLDAIRGDDRIEYAGTRHEAAAAHAADGWARATGDPGVCCATVGPGAANLVSGLYPAFADGIPVVAITAQNQSWRAPPDHGLLQSQMQSLDQISLFRPVTKWRCIVSSWEKIPELVAHAFRVATSGRPGPVQIDVPSDIMFHPGDEADIAVFSSYRAIGKPVGNPDLVRKAAEMLIKADLPLIHAGGGVLRSGAWEELVELAEHLQAPITTSVQGRGSVIEDHPLYLTSILYGTGGLVAQMDADVILLVGGRLGDLEFYGGPPAWGEPETQKLIQVDISPELIGVNRRADLGIVGDAKATLGLLLKNVRELAPKREERDLSFYRQVDRNWLDGLKESCESDAVPINPARLAKEVSEFFPRDAIAVADGGNTTVWVVRLHKVYGPRGFLTASGGDSGHLGAGLPFAIAAKLANPERPVFLETGDGSFGLNLQELETLSRLNLPIVVIVHNDRAWGMIKGGQTQNFDGRYVGVDFKDIRYDRIAEAMGCYGARVEEPSAIREALQMAVDSGRPSVLDVVIDGEVLPTPDFEACIAQWLEGCGK
jgi:acetolactate synthase-1/2/3 large subunit